MYLLTCPQYLQQDVRKNYSEISNMRSYWQYSKAIFETCHYERIIREDHQNCLFNQGEISYNKPSDCKKRWETFM